MPGKMEPLSDLPENAAMLPRTIAGRLFCLIFHVFLFFFLTGAAEAQEKAKLIITGNVRELYPVMTDTPAVENPTLRFEEELRRLKKENPDAYLLQAANHISISTSMETAYSANFCQFFREEKFDVVNLNARDAALGTVAPVCYQYSPPDVMARLITNLATTNPARLDIPVSRTITRKGQAPVTFLSLGSMGEAAGLSGKIALMEETPGDKLAEAVVKGRAANSIVLAISSLSRAEYERNFPTADKEPDVLIDLLDKRGGPPVNEKGVWRIPAPQTGEILLVELERAQPTGVRDPKLERVTYLSPTQLQGLAKYPVPDIGQLIPNVEQVTQQFLNVGPGSVRMDRVDAKGMAELTALENPAIYHVQLDGADFRLYRVMSKVMSYRVPGYQETGWPDMDMIVVMRNDHVLDRVLSRIKFPVGTLPTTVVEALSKLAGKDPSEWEPDPVYAAGVEDVWAWGADAARRVVEMDKKLYGPGGPYYTEPQ